jgi:hypothetical protein
MLKIGKNKKRKRASDGKRCSFFTVSIVFTGLKKRLSVNKIEPDAVPLTGTPPIKQDD